LDSVDPNLGPIFEELRTLLVKRPEIAVQRMKARESWTRFGAARGKIGPERGVTDVLKEDIFIEKGDPLSMVDEDDKIAQRLVSNAGKVNRHNSAPSAIPRRGSGSSQLASEETSKVQAEDELPSSPPLPSSASPAFIE